MSSLYCITSFRPHKTGAIIKVLYKQWKWGIERLSHLTKVTWLASGGGGVLTL